MLSDGWVFFIVTTAFIYKSYLITVRHENISILSQNLDIILTLTEESWTMSHDYKIHLFSLSILIYSLLKYLFAQISHIFWFNGLFSFY